MLPISQLALPQCLLGSEAQLSGFVAALPPPLRARCLFAPLPEMFADARSLQAAWSVCRPGEAMPERLMHLRFGSVRTARLLKGAANAAAVAEASTQEPLATSGHPFAAGNLLPAAMERVFAYAPAGRRVQRIGGGALPVSLLPPACRAADLDAGLLRARAAKDRPGFDIVSFARFDSTAWAAGAVHDPLPDDGVPTILLPWNLDHPGSIVPELLARIAALQSPRAPRVRALVLPFNYLGQTGVIRRLIKRIAEAAGDPAALAACALGRLTRIASLPQLLALSRVAWVEAGDPEHDWTMQRLTAAGLTARSLTSGEDRTWIETGTRYGKLAFHAAVPSLRELNSLLGNAT